MNTSSGRREMSEQKQIWVFIEHTDGQIADVSLELTGKARELGDQLKYEVVGLLCGHTVDDMAQSFPYQFAGNFQKYAGHWNDMPVDAHLLIGLCAPRPVFITGGTQDQWADPRGEFLAEVAAGPVYRLVGKKDLGTSDGPLLDTPLITGDLGFYYHTGGHTITAADWNAFLVFADRYLQPAP